ncbi:MAG: NUDIX hydrolase [Planctomycetota bacterium]
MKFCPQCGAKVHLRVPTGDDRSRSVCTVCESVFYENPRVVVGCMVEVDLGKDLPGLLLCRRAIEPALGRWTPPAGYLELGESARAGAARETWEEARARVEITAPFAEFDLLHVGQLYRMYRARLVQPGFAAGEESLEVRTFSLADIPFGELAFPVLEVALRLYVADRRANTRAVHLGSLVWSGEGSRFDVSNYTVEGHLAFRLA